MRLAVTFLGIDLFSLEVTTDVNSDNGTDPGDCMSYPVGFTGYSGDQRWEQGAGGGEL